MSTGTVLDRIADAVRGRLEERKARLPETELRRRCEDARKPHDFKEPFSRPGMSVIAEVKFSSPSQGKLSSAPELSPVEAAGAYLRNGASAISVLTEEDYFNGKLEYLSAIRSVYPEALLLMKDFVLEEYQLLEALANGADAALLIVALLGRARTERLLGQCRRLGLTALVEVHDEDELAIARETGADLIGVNNRNLKTLQISLETSHRLARLGAGGACLISESGIETGAQLKELKQAGYAGFLIGTSFMRTGTPGAALARLLAEAR